MVANLAELRYVRIGRVKQVGNTNVLTNKEPCRARRNVSYTVNGGPDFVSEHAAGLTSWKALSYQTRRRSVN